MNCPVCLNAEATTVSHPRRDANNVKCPQCGEFTISRSAEADIKSRGSENRWRISAWINEYAPEVLTTNDLDTASAAAIPSLHTRAVRMLRWINKKFPPGKQFSENELGEWKAYKNEPGDHGVEFLGGDLVSSPLVAIGWNRDLHEMRYMVTEVLCNEMQLLVSQNNHEYQVSPKGLLYLEGHREGSSSIAFCAMWFNAEVSSLWAQVIEPATRAAGYEPLRIDGKQHNGKIDDEIMASIRASKFVVSDFTGSRGGVYYEAGFAHGLGLPVIFMCREGDDLHFDVRQYNCIFWKPEELEDARERLKNRILATLGPGQLKV